MSRQMAAESEPISVVTACDEIYVRAAGVTLASASASVPFQQAMDFYVLDGGVSPRSKAKLEQSCAAPGRRFHWLTPDLHILRGLPVSQHINLSTYLRLLLAEMLPAKVERALYLDADTVVVRNLAELWTTPLDGAFCAAVQEVLHPVLEPGDVYDRPLHCMTMPHVDPRPIPNYRDLGLRGTLPYFNAGIMLVNVPRWREQHVAVRGLECLRQNAGQVRYWDQYALNVLFAGQWKLLDPRWNQNSHVFRLPDWKLSHYSQQELWAVQHDPWIVHFTNSPKPWDQECNHPYRELFFQQLDQTAWAGWRPQNRSPAKTRSKPTFSRLSRAA